ncbi:FadR/GntR family transcriptional regulator [uncultured Microbacterium sp.]|uniref:FadR/GntR family transcriptional regulator n=1 Tax=uncultured Microbacterium sp. TaxID=191216 RepID=UPI002608F9D5|nr:FadR/GntR family transcriptional regulator [uncultured Microbacterium sp.]
MSDSTQQVPLQRVSAAEVAFQALKTLISSDDVEVGSRLPGEIELAKRFGVSRSILREALGACATLGLVETRSGRGTFVLSKEEHPQLTFGGYSAADLVEARLNVEIPAAGYAAERRGAEQIAVLRGYLASMREADDLHTWVQLDGQFHRAIGQASGNPVLAAIIDSMRQALDPQSEFLNITRARRAASDVEHARIVDAIEAADPEGARAAAADHIEQVSRALAR